MKFLTAQYQMSVIAKQGPISKISGVGIDTAVED